MKISDKTKSILRTIYGFFFILFVMPSLIALVSTIGFWVLYLSLTHPILAEYQTQWTFKVGMINFTLGIMFTQVIIFFKSIEYVFGKEGK